MPIIENPRREKYAQCLVKGMTQAAAYREAGYETTSQEALWGNASRLARDPEIVARIAEIKVRAAERVEIDRSKVLQMLLEDRDLAREKNQVGAAIRADELLGKEVGMFVDRKEIKTGELDKVDYDELERLRTALVAEATRRATGGNRAGEERTED